jgi:hypothetical protein
LVAGETGDADDSAARARFDLPGDCAAAALRRQNPGALVCAVNAGEYQGKQKADAQN